MHTLLKRIAASILSSVLLIAPVLAVDIKDWADGSRNAQTLDAICRLTREHFYDSSLRGVDWKAACDEAHTRLTDGMDRERFASVANDLLDRLNTSHTRYYPPENSDHAVLMDVFRFSRQLRDIRRDVYEGPAHIDGIGAFGTFGDGGYVISDVLPSLPAHAIGMQPGDTIISIDGEPFHPVRSFLGKAGQTVSLAYRKRGETETSRAELRVEREEPLSLFGRAARASAAMERRDGKDIGYIRFWSLVGDEPQKILREALEEGPLEGADTLVLDIRVKIGGGGPELLDVIDPHAAAMTFIDRRGRRTSRDGYRGKFVMLIDEGTRSAAEILAHIVKRDNLGCLLGETTTGAVTAGRLYPLPDNGVLYMGVNGLEIDGEVLEGRGVAPHIELATDPDVSRGADPQRDAAMALAARLPVEDCAAATLTD